MKKSELMLQSMKRRLTGKRISGGLITLSSAAIFAVYAAGYEQTKEAADRFEQQSAQRLASFPIPVVAEETAVSPGLDSENSNRSVLADPAALHVALAVPVAGAPAVPTNTDSSPAESKVASNPAGTPNVSSVQTLVEAAEIPSTKQTETPPLIEPIAAAITPRAVEPATPVPSPAPPPPVVRQSLYKDGTYEGWGTSRHGDIGVSVVIQDGRIASAVIAQCRTRYPCSWISQLPGQVVSRQSPNVDYVSGATQSVNAYYTAVVEALSRAK
jgi:uncharacterized protein with FMN-binding domain